MIQSTQGREPGQWWPLTDGSAVYRCERCGNLMSLQAHTIMQDGKINPSVVCPHPNAGLDTIKYAHILSFSDSRNPSAICNKCDFHNYVQLVGWQPTTGSEK